jgi:hypothetical protein
MNMSMGSIIMIPIGVVVMALGGYLCCRYLLKEKVDDAPDGFNDETFGSPDNADVTKETPKLKTIKVEKHIGSGTHIAQL